MLTLQMKPPSLKLYVTDIQAVKRFQRKYPPKLRQDFQIIRKSSPATDMNQKAIGPRATSHQAYREFNRELFGEQTEEEKNRWKEIRAELAKTRREAKLPIEPDLPDLWNYDSERLLKELDGIREMILRIPATLETRSALQSAIDRIWRVEQDVRFLLFLQREAQRAFAKKADTIKQSTPTPATSQPVKRSVLH
jgi:hypothetical protein